ncbi:MAG: CPXCG motif-containing cysteine-rich protein [Gammaproteobacteria bacterium]
MTGQLEERNTTCPHCWEPHPLFIDVSSGTATYVEDCTVCCHPMEITITISGDQIDDISVVAE